MFTEKVQKISKIGNSYGILIPIHMLKELGLKGSQKKVKLCSGNGMIQIEPVGQRENRILKAAAKYLKKYRHDFKRLAK